MYKGDDKRLVTSWKVFREFVLGWETNNNTLANSLFSCKGEMGKPE